MTEKPQDLTHQDLTKWIGRVKKAGNTREVFAILDEFRKTDWTDDERSTMAKAYMRVIARVGQLSADEKSEELLPDQNDGPVWYEKM